MRIIEFFIENSYLNYQKKKLIVKYMLCSIIIFFIFCTLLATARHHVPVLSQLPLLGVFLISLALAYTFLMIQFARKHCFTI